MEVCPLRQSIAEPPIVACGRWILAMGHSQKHPNRTKKTNVILLDNCRFEHPSNSGPRPQTSNRFTSGGNAQNGLGMAPSSIRLAGCALTQPQEKYSISLETLEKDLTIERPQWILSAYAPGRGCPDQLFGGYPREQSFEEMRLHYMMGKTAGNEQQAVSAGLTVPRPSFWL